MNLDSTKNRDTIWQIIAMALILAMNAYFQSAGLGNEALRPPDEVCHAVVARHLMDQPAVPMLYRDAYLPPEAQNAWLSTQVWLHKPPMALWTAALSMKIMGVSTLAFRMPSLVLSCGAVLLTFLIGRRIYDGWAGVLAAMIQALAPAIGMLVRGVVFSDAVDISLLFWTELSIYLMLGEHRVRMWTSGVACGLAFLSKLYPALYVIAPLALLTFVRWRALNRSSDSPDAPARKRLIQGLAGWFVGLFVVAGSWMMYTGLWYPKEFDRESGMIFSHLTQDVEMWAGRWDRVWFQLLPMAMLHFFTLCVVGFALVIYRSVHEKKWTGLLAPLWLLAVTIPFTLAVSKTPSSTLCAWPAFALCGGATLARACRSYVVESVSVIYILSLNAVGIVTGAKFSNPELGMTQPFEVMRQNIWILQHLAGAVVAIGLGFVLARRVVRYAQYPDSSLRRGITTMGLGLAMFAGYQNSHAYLNNRNVPDKLDNYREVGAWIDGNLPSNAAVLLNPTRGRYAHVSLMFWANRSCYAFNPAQAVAQVRQIESNGGQAFAVTPATLNAPKVFEDAQGYKVYRLELPK